MIQCYLDSAVDIQLRNLLANELKDPEEHKLIERVVHDSTPVLIEYKLLPHAESITEVIATLKEWGLKHRKVVMGK